MSSRRQSLRNRTDNYRRQQHVKDRCSDCGKWYYVYRNSHYIYGLCPECLEATPFMPYEGDHKSGARDPRVGLRHNGQEGDDYFG